MTGEAIVSEISRPLKDLRKTFLVVSGNQIRFTTTPIEDTTGTSRTLGAAKNNRTMTLLTSPQKILF